MTATLVRRSQLAKRLGVSPSAIDTLVSTGNIPPQRPGTQFWVLETVLERLLGPAIVAASEVSPYDDWKRSRDARQS